MAFLLSVVNFGPETATGVQAIDNLPAGMTLISVSSDLGHLPHTTTITCNVGTLTVMPAAGSIATITIVVKPVAGSVDKNSPSGNEPDGNGSNNFGTASIMVALSADLQGDEDGLPLAAVVLRLKCLTVL